MKITYPCHEEPESDPKFTQARNAEARVRRLPKTPSSMAFRKSINEEDSDDEQSAQDPEDGSVGQYREWGKYRRNKSVEAVQ